MVALHAEGCKIESRLWLIKLHRFILSKRRSGGTAHECGGCDQSIGLLLLLLLKKDSSARLGESDIHPISPKTPAPQYQPIDRKKRKGKRVEDYSRDRAA